MVRKITLAVACGAIALASVAGCTGSSSAGSGSSITQTPAQTSFTDAGNWRCPASPSAGEWSTSKNPPPGTMVTPGPTYAFECTYRQRGNEPSTLYGDETTYTGQELAALVESFNTAIAPNHGMSCPAPIVGGYAYTSKYRFIYPDGKSAVVTRSGYCPPVITNGDLTRQDTAPSSDAPTPSN